MFFATSLLIPQKIADSGIDLEKHFNKVRRPVCWSFFAFMVAQFLDSPFLVADPWWFLGRIPQLTVLGAAAGCALTTNELMIAFWRQGLDLSSIHFATHFPKIRLVQRY